MDNAFPSLSLTSFLSTKTLPKGLLPFVSSLEVRGGDQATASQGADQEKASVLVC